MLVEDKHRNGFFMRLHNRDNELRHTFLKVFHILAKWLNPKNCRPQVSLMASQKKEFWELKYCLDSPLTDVLFTLNHNTSSFFACLGNSHDVHTNRMQSQSLLSQPRLHPVSVPACYHLLGKYCACFRLTNLHLMSCILRPITGPTTVNRYIHKRCFCLHLENIHFNIF